DAGAQILANLAFHLADTMFFPAPGSVARDVVRSISAGELSERLPHVYIQSPRAWGLELPLDEGPPAITLAQVVPISETEYAAWKQFDDVDRFEQYLLERRIDVADLGRTGS